VEHSIVERIPGPKKQQQQQQQPKQIKIWATLKNKIHHLMRFLTVLERLIDFLNIHNATEIDLNHMKLNNSYHSLSLVAGMA